MIQSATVTPLSADYSFSSSLLGYGGTLCGEWLFLYNPNSTFYFMCSNECEVESFCQSNNWYIISSCRFNESTQLGVGFRDSDQVEGSFYRVESEEKLKMWTDILRFTFNQEYKELYFPYDNYFNGMVKIEDSFCFYIHDYVPVSQKSVATIEQRKTANMVFRFKEGFYIPFMVKVFTLAMERLRIITHHKENTILIPIPASTKERNINRFSRLLQAICGRLKIENGFDAVSILSDRPQLKGSCPSVDKLSNLSFCMKRIKGKNVILMDDILTTGSGFTQMKHKMIELGAVAVTGVFLARTKEQEK